MICIFHAVQQSFLRSNPHRMNTSDENLNARKGPRKLLPRSPILELRFYALHFSKLSSKRETATRAKPYLTCLSFSTIFE